MGDFLPEEYCTIEAAIETAVAAWYPQELGKTTVTAEDHQYLGQNSAHKIGDPEDDRVKEIRKRFKERSRLSDQSFDRLRQIMFKGTLPTYLFADSGEILPFPSVRWGSDDADKARRLGGKVVEKSWQNRIGRVVIAKKELENVLAGRPAHEPTTGVGIGASSAAVETAEIRNTALASEALQDKGGAPFVYHWDEIWAEIVRRVHDEGLPEKKSHLVKAIQDWCELKYRIHPSLTSLKPKIALVFKAMERHENGQ